MSGDLRKLLQLEESKSITEPKSASARLDEQQQAVYLFLEAVDRIAFIEKVTTKMASTLNDTKSAVDTILQRLK